MLLGIVICSILTKALEHHDGVSSFAWMQHQLLSSAPDHNPSVSASGLQESRHSLVTKYMQSTSTQCLASCECLILAASLLAALHLCSFALQ